MKDGTRARTEFNPDEVYQGIEVVGRKLEETSGRDWALVRLDRSVPGRNPVKFRRRGKIRKNRDLFVIVPPGVALGPDLILGGKTFTPSAG